MEPELDEYVGRRRDSKRERELLKRLKLMPEDACYSFVLRLLQRDRRIGLHMASASLRQKRHFQEILEIGLKEGDASTILPWLECAVPKLGFRLVVSALDSRVESDPQAVDNAAYWMPRFKPQEIRSDLAWDRLKSRRRRKADMGMQIISMTALVEGSAKDAG